MLRRRRRKKRRIRSGFRWIMSRIVRVWKPFQVVALWAVFQVAFAADIVQKREDFTVDPKWQIFTTRQAPSPWPRVTQNFGWKRGEVGGLISRSTVPASYARVIPAKTLNQPLKASGKFRLTKNFGNSGILFGWFNESSRGWRTPNSLVFRLDGNGPGYWVFFEYGTQHGLTAGKGCFEGERYQTTRTKPFAADGTEHTWSLEYSPTTDGGGLITFVLDEQPWTIAVDPSHKADGAIFNRFGILAVQLSGDGAEAWFSDLLVDGERIDLSNDPKWESRGARAEFAAPIVRPFNDAKWRPTAQAGGQTGEIGGVFWRDDPPAFYATSCGPLTLEDELFASGRIVLADAATDSGVYFGWFNATSKTNRPARDRTITQTNALVIAIEGPSRIGHYFRAAFWNSAGQGILQSEGPVLPPDGKPRLWSLHYVPTAANGRGEITIILGDETTSVALPDGVRKSGAIFDHFGFLNFQPDGHYVKVFIDDLEFSARNPASEGPKTVR